MYVFEGAEADLVEKKEVPVPPGPPGFFVKKGTDPIFVRSRLGTQLASRPAYVTVSVSS